jgi:hypothetical protein
MFCIYIFSAFFCFSDFSFGLILPKLPWFFIPKFSINRHSIVLQSDQAIKRTITQMVSKPNPPKININNPRKFFNYFSNSKTQTGNKKFGLILAKISRDLNLENYFSIVLFLGPPSRPSTLENIITIETRPI